MRILCSFPGRYGDLIWSLPSIRALSRRIGQPIDLQIAGEFASIVPLLVLQPYLREVVADDRWALTPPDEWAAPPLSVGDGYGYTHVLNLGYRGWPHRALPFVVLDNLNAYINGSMQRDFDHAFIEEDLDLQTPWITVPPLPEGLTCAWACAFTEAHFELKYGLWELLTCGKWWVKGYLIGEGPLLLCTGGRWQTEAAHGGVDWIRMAAWMSRAPVVLADCSAPHVLAVACGTPVVMYEPMEARWNPIFFPLGKVGPQVTLVTGNDGLPTCDSRHTADAIEAALARGKG